MSTGSSFRVSYSRSGSAFSSTSSITSTGSSSENLPPRTLTRVAREIRTLHKNPPEGVRLVVEETGSLSEIIAELEGPTGTPYESRYFQLKLVLPSDFPASPPRGYFLTKIYHPNVEMSNGSICVNTLKRDWSDTTTLGHVLSVIRCLLIVPFPESSLNDEAGKLFMESYDEYNRRARLMADVHGRPRPCCSYESDKNDLEEEGGDVSVSLRKKDCGGSENRMGGGNKTSSRKDGNNQKKEGKKVSAEKKNKKKGLKRL
mmetsp:Transcript_2578/g.3950  ORF Transcript_2578/g.3950 Transcript_2578/m.3950 type:complete len:259 (+) Transcript_2578:140-916(+)|eukprot:CAMPEP_0195522090 /NCGR_PEP_ID=MMETSP0794_2-20130614/20022_1 /TAXON_ID=515487 /ORGANISM="Stephanopyxis turris, Strain CCMP 815" /LENGTH=258 /DNA_ID=CAMNT_0040651777 /DNA_START=131 /DNA_END=907 /DNA_ORIENTATION=-